MVETIAGDDVVLMSKFLNDEKIDVVELKTVNAVQMMQLMSSLREISRKRRQAIELKTAYRDLLKTIKPVYEFLASREPHTHLFRHLTYSEERIQRYKDEAVDCYHQLTGRHI